VPCCAVEFCSVFAMPEGKVCGHKASVEVDYIVKARIWVAEHGGDVNAFYDEANLQGLCSLCHKQKTRRGL
jgi:5-methylcytosine-specific restriction endonuclease McrA